MFAEKKIKIKKKKKNIREISILACNALNNYDNDP